MDGGRIHQVYDTFRGRLVMFLVVYGALGWFIYGGLERHLVGGGVAPASIPSYDIHQGDFLLFWRQIHLYDSPRRGDLVMFKTREFRRGDNPFWGQWAGDRRQWGGDRGDTLGRLIAFAGEKVEATGGVLTITALDGHIARYASPLSAGFDFTLTVPSGHSFCFPVAVHIANRGVNISNEEIIRIIALPETIEFHGRAIMVYNTVFRTTWLPRIPLDRAN